MSSSLMKVSSEPESMSSLTGCEATGEMSCALAVANRVSV